MHDIQYTYDPSEQPKFEEIGTIRVPGEIDQLQAFLPHHDEVIIKIKCQEGWMYVVRKNYHTPKPGK